jgi:uncharacterized membrane protein
MDLLVKMNLRFYVISSAVLLGMGVLISLTSGLPFLADSNITATIHGATYAGDTLEPLTDTVININSNPPQSIVAKNGTYSFELVPGDYVITARSYRNNTLIYSKETTLKITDNGIYVLDLLLYPTSKNQEEIAARINNLDSMGSTEQTGANSSNIKYLPVAFMLFLLLGGGYKFTRTHKKTRKNNLREGKIIMLGILDKVFRRSSGFGAGPDFRTVGEYTSIDSAVEPAGNPVIDIETQKKLPLSAELLEILDIIRGHKGRITQKDLRSRLEHSEVKVSLLLSELERRGNIKKFKNGRENIVVLLDEEY